MFVLTIGSGFDFEPFHTSSSGWPGTKNCTAIITWAARRRMERSCFLRGLSEHRAISMNRISVTQKAAHHEARVNAAGHHDDTAKDNADDGHPVEDVFEFCGCIQQVAIYIKIVVGSRLPIRWQLFPLAFAPKTRS